ncbi:unnamed protein product [Euphydryas editha]|uniref:Endonuclease/exonuclease/phosphatase domain-containing protein n=1 Tax=Euphydryas editha TaxID=104508 RepID=A0AAU9UUU1_EUPED|nr:unnamed protein product [Euphydryas editha]
MDRYNFDIMALNETWLRQGEDGRAPRVPGYRLHHIPRPEYIRARGGGVGFYIKKGICTQTHSHPITPNVEQMWISIKGNGKLIYIGTAYRPPWLPVKVFLDALTDTIGSLSYYDYIYLTGDFNINFLNVDNSEFRLLQEFLRVHNLLQCTKLPTHFKSDSATLLDLVCSNVNLDRVWVEYIPDLSSHALISFEVNIHKEKLKTRKIYYRPIKDIVSNKLQDTINTINWSDIAHDRDVNDMVRDFSACML